MHQSGTELPRVLTVVAGAPELKQDQRRILLFVSPPGSVSDAMSAAIEREFGWISVKHVAEPRMACQALGGDVQLIIVDHSLFEAFQRLCHDLSSIHPDAMLAIMAAAQFKCSPILMQIIESQSVRGILPNDVNLDLWLSIIRIMLKGGTYIPPALLMPRPQQNQMQDRTAHMDERPSNSVLYEQWGSHMDGLTERELEVLAMVSRGHQNKIIAADLGLSEHTVKIHIHNIIRKLGVHNRTEAAAKYFERSSHRDDANG